MKIGFNCLNVDPTYKGGVNTYVFGLIEGLIASITGNPSFKLYIFCKKQNSFKFEHYKSDQVHVIIINNPFFLIKRLMRRICLYILPIKLYKKLNDFLFSNIGKTINSLVDLVYIPTTVLDFYSYKVPSVLSMHDIQHVHYPEFFTKNELRVRKTLYGLSAQNASYFQASSNFIKNDLLANFKNISKDSIFVIEEGVDIKAFQEPTFDTALLEKYSLPSKFIFYPAQLWKHKNHITILKALCLLRSQGIVIPIVLTGSSYSGSKEIFDFIKSHSLNNVYYLGVVPFEVLKILYKKCQFLITAVLYESSSLPILEAAASGRPIVASLTPPNFEMSQILKINLFPSLDAETLSNLIKEKWEDTSLDEINLNLKNIQNYSWNNVAQKYLSYFEKIVK